MWNAYVLTCKWMNPTKFLRGREDYAVAQDWLRTREGREA